MIKILLAGIILASGTLSGLHGADSARSQPSENEIMATMSVNDGLWNAASRVLGARDQFSRSPSLLTAQQLAAELNFLASACSHYRRNVRDSGWQDISPDFLSLTKRVRRTVNIAVTAPAHVVEHLHSSLNRCENAAR